GVAATATTLTINQTQTSSSGSVFTLTSSVVTVAKTADFQINGECYFNSGGTNRSEYTMWLEVDTGAGFAEVPGTRAGIYERGYDSGGTSAFTTILSVTSGDDFRIRIQRTSGGGTTGYQEDNGTRFTFIEVG
ncbi:MAG: hypothetical protein WBM86_03355, partial [Waterburya sp.]